MMAKVDYGDNFGEPFAGKNPDIAYDIFNKYYTPYLKVAKVEKGKLGVFAYLDDGTALYFIREYVPLNPKGWENTYFIACLTHQACERLDDTSFNTILQGLGIERFGMYTDGRIPNWSFIKHIERSQIIENCKNGSNIESCTALIGGDGWVIPDDYPFKF